MKSLTRTIPVFLFALLALCGFCGCASRYPCEEIPPFPYAERSDKYLIFPDTSTEQFDRRAFVGETEFFYDSHMSGSAVDRGIDAVQSLSFCQTDVPVYLSENALSHRCEEAFWVDPDNEARLLGAVALAFQDGESLPFGLYAGASMYLLEESPKYTGSALEKRLGKYPYCRELQYPLYTAEKTTREERETAWSFAYSVAAKWFETGTLGELLASSEAERSALLSSAHAELPDCKFYIGDNHYGTRAETKNFFYLFPRNYVDKLYGEKDFSLSYPVLTEFFRENEAYLEETCPLLGVKELPKRVTAYLGGMGGWEFLTNGNFSGYFNYAASGEPYIVCNTVSPFLHEVTHYILECAGQSYHNCLNEAMCTYFALRSGHDLYYRLVEWQLYSENGKNYYDKFFHSGISAAAVKELKAIGKLYDKTFGEAREENFSPIKFYLCMAKSRSATVADMLPAADEYNYLKILFAGYLFENYGREALFAVDRLWEYAKIGEKTFGDLTEEWIAQLYATFE